MWEAHAADATTQTKTGPEVSLRTCSFRKPQTRVARRGQTNFPILLDLDLGAGFGQLLGDFVGVLLGDVLDDVLRSAFD